MLAGAGGAEQSRVSATDTAEASWAQPDSTRGCQAAPGTFHPVGLFTEGPGPGKVKHLLGTSMGLSGVYWHRGELEGGRSSI